MLKMGPCKMLAVFFCGNHVTYFFRILCWRESLKEQHLFDLFCNNVKAAQWVLKQSRCVSNPPSAPFWLEICFLSTSCSTHQWYTVQLHPRAQIRQADRVRILSWLHCSFWVQPWIPSPGIQSHQVSRSSQCSSAVERHHPELYR